MPSRVIVPFCDQWADPGPDGACYDACLEALATRPERLDPRQVPACLVMRYVSEVDQGGHARYFLSLDQDAARLVTGTMEELCHLGLFHAADILSRAHARWGKRAGVPASGTHLTTPSPVADFSDLDDEYAILGLADQADHPQTVFDTYLRSNAELFVELAPPTPDDQHLIEIGDPRLHIDGGRKAWLAVSAHTSPRVRLKAAEHLMVTDREEALQIAHGVRIDPRSSPWVLSKILKLLRKAGVSLDGG